MNNDKQSAYRCRRNIYTAIHNLTTALGAMKVELRCWISPTHNLYSISFQHSIKGFLANINQVLVLHNKTFWWSIQFLLSSSDNILWFRHSKWFNILVYQIFWFCKYTKTTFYLRVIFGAWINNMVDYNHQH